ncbi:MAG: helix-turn-helix domain-containing protein [Armatimonadota bacterium]
MNDNSVPFPPAPIGAQIRNLRASKGWSLEELAARAGTSAPTLHRYEGGWERFELATLRRIASALGARLEVRLLPSRRRSREPGRSAWDLVRLLAPLFWDKPLALSNLTDHPLWVLRRVLLFGDARQVDAARRFFGDHAIREAVAHRGVDARTRTYWHLILDEGDAP